LRDTVANLYQAILLWRIWTRLGAQDVRLRFRRSAIGVSWIFANLTITVLSIGLIYGALFKLEVNSFVPWLTVSIVIWGYITASIVEGGNAFVGSEGYIKQIALPIHVYIFRWFVSISMTSLISLSAYIVVVPAFGVRIGTGILWALPGTILLAVVSLLAIAIFAHVNAQFRDTTHLAGSIMQVLFYVTPVIWPAEILRERGLDQVVDLNPFYHLLEVVRRPLLYSEPAGSTSYLAVGLIILMMGVLAAFLLPYYHRRVVFFL
jgi:ABC-type polysaccharide/polyol phosphate export permease